jgi:capsular polysaccharide biosynthesis protein
MQVTVLPIESWPAAETVATGLEPFSQYGATIEPSLTRHNNVLLTGRDWLPIKDGRVALLVHTPSRYLSKGGPRPVRSTPQGLVADTGPVRRLPGPSILIGSSPNHYHWLIDHVPRLLMAQRVMPLPRVLINAPNRLQRETLDRLGVTSWEVVDEAESVLCEQLWIPSLLACTTLPHPAVPNLLRDAFCASRGSPHRRVAISRSDASSRRLVNEPQARAVLERHGFETHVTGVLDLHSQISLFSEARVIAGVHGAGLTNMVFAPPGARVFELYTPAYKITFMQLLALACGHHHEFVPCRVIGSGPDGNPMLADWEADLDALDAALAGHSGPLPPQNPSTGA